MTILAMERGAVDFVTKPTNIIEAKGDAFRKEILGILNAVLKTERISLTERRPAVAAVSAVQKRNASAETRFKNKIVALACSTVDQKLCRVSFLSAGQSGCPNGSCAAYACRIYEFHGKPSG